MMQTTQFIWQNGQFIPWAQANVHVLTHGLHYGSGVFEGIRFYETANGPAILKLPEHVGRLFYSARQLSMTIPYSEAEICDAIVETVRRNDIKEGYIRPLVYYGYGSLKVVPEQNLPVDICIACWPWGAYLAHDAVDVKTSSFIRIHPRSTIADAKISGHYVNSILAGLELRNTHYHEALLLDADGYVAEGSAENIFIVKDGVLFTPPVGTILEGITRNMVIDLAQRHDIPVEQRRFTPQDIIQADEAFFSGTAVEITPIRSLDDQVIGDGHIGDISRKIQNAYQQIVRGQVPEFQNDLTWVSPVDEVTV
jgi:branched-chain amino acid aminotransferase